MKIGIYLVVLIFLFSCSEASIRSGLKKYSWTVEEVVFEGITYESFFFRVNTMSFKEGSSCKLPYFYWASNFQSEWYISNVRSNYFDLTLTNSDRNFLDGTYKSRIDRKSVV